MQKTLCPSLLHGDCECFYGTLKSLPEISSLSSGQMAGGRPQPLGLNTHSIPLFSVEEKKLWGEERDRELPGGWKGTERRKEKRARTGNFSAFGHQKHHMQITCKFYANDPFLLYPHPLNSWRAFSESSQIFAPRSCCPQIVINLDPSWGPSGPPVVTSDPLGRTSRKSLAPQPHFYLSKLSTSFASRTEGSGS